MGKILVVVTNVSKYETIDHPTGLWLSEAVHFVDVMGQAGWHIDYVSPLGGYTPIDPLSLHSDSTSPVDWKYYTDHNFMSRLGNTLSIQQVNPNDYDIIYYTGGHGVIWDFPNNEGLQHIARSIYENGGIVSSVCHGAAGLLNITLSSGRNLIDGIMLTGFANSEEVAAGLNQFVPFLTEDELRKRGALYSKGADFTPYTVSDRRVITGQNPASGAAVANAILRFLHTK